jgi:hypothetical protein
MTTRLIVILFILICSCSTKTPVGKIQVPQSFLVHIQWGGLEKRNNFFYYTRKNISSLYFTDVKDSVFERKYFEIDKQIADSLYILAYRNSRQFDLADSSQFDLSDGGNLSITLHTGDKTVKNSYSGLYDYSVNSDINQITEIIKRITKDKKLFD